MPQAVMISNIQWCCGAYILENFNKNIDPLTPKTAMNYYVVNSLPRENIEDFCKRFNPSQGAETTDQYKERIRRSTQIYIDQWTNKKSFLLVILNNKEKEIIEETILDLGFEVCIPETRNPTGTAITMYVYHLLPREVGKTESIMKKVA